MKAWEESGMGTLVPRPTHDEVAKNGCTRSRRRALAIPPKLRACGSQSSPRLLRVSPRPPDGQVGTDPCRCLRQHERHDRAVLLRRPSDRAVWFRHRGRASPADPPETLIERDAAGPEDPISVCASISPTGGLGNHAPESLPSYIGPGGDSFQTASAERSFADRHRHPVDARVGEQLASGVVDHEVRAWPNVRPCLSTPRTDRIPICLLEPGEQPGEIVDRERLTLHDMDSGHALRLALGPREVQQGLADDRGQARYICPHATTPRRTFARRVRTARPAPHPEGVGLPDQVLPCGGRILIRRPDAGLQGGGSAARFLPRRRTSETGGGSRIDRPPPDSGLMEPGKGLSLRAEPFAESDVGLSES